MGKPHIALSTDSPILFQTHEHIHMEEVVDSPGIDQGTPIEEKGCSRGTKYEAKESEGLKHDQ